MNKTTNIPALFGCKVFNEQVMRERLPDDIYEALHKTISEGTELDKNVATAVAAAMKDWAIENGATHFTHWFQPMTGVTAEKHDSFISPSIDGTVITEFSGKELRRGEPDASSFPSGGLRATFEARGYTAWDPTSYAFIKDDSLCIPTAFCSYSGEVLDKKTPLLRSMEAINKQALRILRLFGDTTTKRVIPTVGAEQEYFLIDKELFKKRKDLIFTGRTLFGARPPKGQELDDHYFGSIKPRVMEYMCDLNAELWKLGVFAKTEHNESAPSQHELAPVFASANTATDHNQLTMEMMRKIADKHGLACLLHEKPFKGVNGSGKHNNWSLSTDSGENLFSPGKSPYENKRFLLLFSAVIKATDEYQDLIRLTTSEPGNDHRLGGNEAPPAIVSLYIGDDLSDVFDAIENGKAYEEHKSERMKTGVNMIPDFKKDTSDRNRTSPFAFTGSKFELRTPGASVSISGPNTVLNTITAEVLSSFADRLEKSNDFDQEVINIIKDTYSKHKRIIFNGNNYSPEWEKEAAKRGLLNLKTTVDALPSYLVEKNINLFEKHNIFSIKELESRHDILTDNYRKVLGIEAVTMLDMVRKDIIPASLKYADSLSEGIYKRSKIGLSTKNDKDIKIVEKIVYLVNELYTKADNTEKIIKEISEESDILKKSFICRDKLSYSMNEMREIADDLELIVSSEYWPFPTYGDLLYSV